MSHIPRGDARNFAWNGLSIFRNIEHTSRLITIIHDVPARHAQNVRKQAEQIRYCLIQAKEYFDAARSVTMATRPLLQYYGIMSLALAEIMLKGSGEQSLDRARGQHAHHGLDFRLDRDASRLHELSASAGALRAVPLMRGGGERFGTFELWHGVAREAPACGIRSVHHGNGLVSSSSSAVLTPADVRLPLVPEAGLTLLDCIQSIPGMQQYLNSVGENAALVRAGISVDVPHDNSHNYRIIFHPNVDEILNELYESILVKPCNINDIKIEYFPSGIGMEFSIGSDNIVDLKFPVCYQIETDEILFNSRMSNLNEFGLYYFSSYILGNYARYFPDKWMVDVESASPLAMASWALSERLEERVALLTLAEFNRTIYLYS